MANIRRVIRKTRTAASDAFDEQLWPVNVALVVLGGFMMGVQLAYLKLVDHWYASALTWIVVTACFVGGTMFVLRHINNRMVRRTVQFSLVLSVLAHLVFLVSTFHLVIFSRWFPANEKLAHLTPQRPPVVIPEYHPSQQNQDRPQQEFERPVETDTPEPEQPEEVERQQVEPQQRPQPPQPTPVPKPQPTPTPQVERQNVQATATPKHAERSARLSRQTRQVQPQASQAAAAASQTARQAPSPSQPSPTQSALQRQSTQAAPSRQQPVESPMTVTPQQQPRLARRASQEQPTPDSSSRPTLERRVNQPTLTPKTQVESNQTPTVARQTQPDQVQPNQVAAQRTETSPAVQRQPTPPVPETPAQTDPQPQRRQAEATESPNVAQTPSPQPARQQRRTTRPDVQATASRVTPSPSPSQSEQRTARIEARSAPVSRAQTASAARAQPSPATQPSPTTTPQQMATPTRRQSTSQPTTTSAAAQRLARATPRPSTPTTTPVQAARAASVTQQVQSGEVSPTSTATTRQATSGSQVARQSGEPSPATSRSVNAAATSRAVSRNQAQVNDAPQVTQSQGASTPRRTTAPAAAAVASAQAVEQTSAPTTANDPQPRPTTSSVARQASASPAASRQAARSLPTPSASPSTQVASTAAARATASDVPTVSPQAQPTPSPSRAARNALAAASPQAVESPSPAQAAPGAGQATPQPSQTALSRAVTGTAGIGRAANLDRAQPAADKPALVASGSSARRATQSSDEGPALAPSEVAAVSRARAGAQTPSASLPAQDVEVANAAGSSEPSELTASASASLNEAASNAESSEVTAARGEVQVDLGPTRVVSGGAAGRAGGGGQPELTPPTQANQVARASGGGTPTTALAATNVQPAPAAPAGDGGGQPSLTQVAPSELAATRTDAGSDQPVSGGPVSSPEVGSPTEMSTADNQGQNQMKRADAVASAGSPDSGAGEPDLEDEEEKARRLARAARGGGPQLALAAPTIADVPQSPEASSAAGDPGSPPPGALAADVSAATVARATLGGAPEISGGPQTVEAAGTVGGGGEVASNQVRRAEAVDAPTGVAEAGGGSASPQRASRGPQFAAPTQAATVELAGRPQSGGQPQGAPLQAQGIEQGRLAGGAVGPASQRPVGAQAGPAVVDAKAGLVGSATGTRRGSEPLSGEPDVGDVADSGGPGRSGPRTMLSPSDLALAPIAVPSTGSGQGGGASDADMGDLAGGMNVGPMSRSAAGNLAANMEAVEGPGGLGGDIGTEIGLNNRLTQQDTVQIGLQPARFVRTKVGGTPDFNTAAVLAGEPFQRRVDRTMGDTPGGGGKGSPGPETEEAIEHGLAFLARHQQPDGSWTLKGFNEEVALTSDTAATALALLSFQGAGYTHKDYKYADVVRKGIDFLRKNQQENGDVFIPLDDKSNRSVWFYSHSLAAIALTEAYGMTQDPELRDPAQRAIDFLVESQHKTRGGWRYSPNYGSDTSVTGWGMMALKSAELANLEVPDAAFEKVVQWMDMAQSSGKPHLYRYNPRAPDTEQQRHGRVPSPTMTSVGLLARLYFNGWERDNTTMIEGADYLMEHLPSYGTARAPKRDTYYWYYATQVMFHMGGKYWEAWNAKLHPLMIDRQVKEGPLAGSWDPRAPIPDRWAPHAGRLYVTTMNLLSLEVHYRHLPLYIDVKSDDAP